MSELSKEERDRVIRKIKHCLALSTSSNENEAATALRQAQKLMEKYRLSELDVQLSDVGMTESEKEKAKASRPTWERDLSSMVAVAFGCKSYTQRQACMRRLLMVEVVVFVGVSPAHEIAKYAFDTLLTKLVHARKQFMADIRAGRVARGRYSTETRGNHFAHAWVAAVSQKLDALVPETDDLTASDSKALVLSQSREHALIDQFMHQLTNGEKIRKARGGKMAKPNRGDLVAGFQAGERTQLNHGVGSATSAPVAIGKSEPEQGSFF